MPGTPSANTETTTTVNRPIWRSTDDLPEYPVLPDSRHNNSVLPASEQVSNKRVNVRECIISYLKEDYLFQEYSKVGGNGALDFDIVKVTNETFQEIRLRLIERQLEPRVHCVGGIQFIHTGDIVFVPGGEPISVLD